MPPATPPPGDGTGPEAGAFFPGRRSRGGIFHKRPGVGDGTTAAPRLGATSPSVGGCMVFPPESAWNRDISQESVDRRSATWIRSMMGNKGLHPDFGTQYGIPYVVVPQSQPLAPVTFTTYASESDPGPYPLPFDLPIEPGGDAHAIVIQQGTCFLYELFGATRNPFTAQNGAVWHLNEDYRRPEGWTSADAAGLPIFAGLIRYDEVEAGEIRHALRFTAHRTQDRYVFPASHQAGHNGASLPPMGIRVRLRASVDLSAFSPHIQVILRAMQTYGMFLADNGSDWFVTGANDPRWNDDELGALRRIHGSDFEVIRAGELQR
jgi:hypothetical protein